MSLPFSLHHAEPIPLKARSEIDALLTSGDLFRYHREEASPVTQLEEEFASLMGVKYALAVASCSAALFLSLKTLNLGDNAKVLIPAFTFAAVPSAVLHANCTPILVEVGENYRINMDDFKQKCDETIKAVLISHMRGHTSDMDAIKKICDEKNIPLIEDAAHSLGTQWNGRPIGTIGKVGCFSFQSYKLLNAGEGGILITDDDAIIAKAVIMSGAYEKKWQKHGLNADLFDELQDTLPLYNTRLSNLSAAVLLPQLNEIERRAKDGLKNHEYVASKLNAHPHLSVPNALPQETRAPDSLQFNLVNVTDAQATFFINHAKAQGLDLSIFGMQAHNARAFWNWKFLDSTPSLPQTRAMLMRAVDLRLPARLQTRELDAISDVILTSLNATMMAEMAAE